MKKVMSTALLCLLLGGLPTMTESWALANERTDAPSSPPLIPIEDFFRNPSSVSFRLSPDGSKLAYLKPWEKRLNVFMRNIDGLAMREADELRLTSYTDRDVGDLFWKGNDRLIFVRDKGGDENFHIYTVSLDGSEPRELTPFDGVRASLLDDLKDDPRHILILMNKENPEVYDVYRVDLDTGEMTQTAKNPGNVLEWMTDHDGRLRMALQTDGTDRSVLYRPNEDAPFKTLVTTSFRDNFTPLLFSFDNKKLYVCSNLGRDKTAIFEYDPDKNEETRLIYENSDVDAEGLLFSKKRKVIIGVAYTTDKTRYHFLDEDIEKLHKILKEKFPEREVAVTVMDDDERRAILLAYSDRSRGSYFLYDRISNTLEKLADLTPWLDENLLAEMTPVKYDARDGLTVHGYLTLPKGVEPRNLPLVVIPHGGPWLRDVWGYDPEAQFIANRGAAVLQPNFRGSTGYGKAFWQAGFKQWGRDMQNDITDGVEYLIRSGVADRKRVAIYGASYGGYATLAGAAFTPDLYACAVSYVGVSNLFTFLSSIPPYWKQELEMMYEKIGHPDKDKALLEEISPLFHIDKIKIPLLIAHGANDPRVKKAESDQIVEAVRNKGREVIYMVKDDEGHGFHNEENKLDLYCAMEDFFSKHLGLRRTPLTPSLP